jgi:hypothetical protein
LMREQGRLQRVSRAATTQVTGGEPPQFVVNQRRQLVERTPFARAPALQQLCDLPWRRQPLSFRVLSAISAEPLKFMGRSNAEMRRSLTESLPERQFFAKSLIESGAVLRGS